MSYREGNELGWLAKDMGDGIGGDYLFLSLVAPCALYINMYIYSTRMRLLSLSFFFILFFFCSLNYGGGGVVVVSIQKYNNITKYQGGG